MNATFLRFMVMPKLNKQWYLMKQHSRETATAILESPERCLAVLHASVCGHQLSSTAIFFNNTHMVIIC
jgi:hypothetical protein